MFYKVPFQQVLELVRQRAVLLVAGMAFVPKRRLVSLFVNEFRAYVRHATAVATRAYSPRADDVALRARALRVCVQLSHMLVEAHRFLPSVLRDERLEPILTTLGKGYTGPDYGSSRFVCCRDGHCLRHARLAEMRTMPRRASPFAPCSLWIVSVLRMWTSCRRPPSRCACSPCTMR